MKTTRKLIPALAMLLVSAIMLSTASFAWFASNDQVTAKNMSVTAKSAARFLEISADGVDYSYEVDADNDEKADLQLVNANIDDDNKSITWSIGTSRNPSHQGAITGAVDMPDDGGVYALVNNFYVRMAVGSQYNLTNFTVGSVTVTETATCEIKQSLRVLVAALDEDDAVVAAQIWSYTNGTAMVKADGADVLIATVTQNATKLAVYVYYDGEDPTAITNNTNYLGAMSVDVTFVTTDPQPAT